MTVALKWQKAVSILAGVSFEILHLQILILYCMYQCRFAYQYNQLQIIHLIYQAFILYNMLGYQQMCHGQNVQPASWPVSFPVAFT